MEKGTEGTLPNSFYEAIIILTQSYTKTIKKKIIGQYPYENRCKNSHKIPANKIQEHIKKIYPQ